MKMGYANDSFPKGSLFLVTGGAGFIGSNLCEAILNLGYRVRCLDDLSTGHYENIEPFLADPNFSFIKGDVKDLETCLKACGGADYVLHQAAWGSVPRSIEMPLFYCVNNIMGTLNMMEAARRNGVKKFVYASSSSVYARTFVCTNGRCAGHTYEQQPHSMHRSTHSSFKAAPSPSR